jgi:hypothetical protein
MDIEIKLDSFNKTYNAGDYISGIINISSTERLIEFNSINMNLMVLI